MDFALFDRSALGRCSGVLGLLAQEGGDILMIC